MVQSCSPRWWAHRAPHRQSGRRRVLPRVMNTGQHVPARPGFLDYGPYGFIDAYAGLRLQPLDPGGRYALDQQPAVGTGTCRSWPRRWPVMWMATRLRRPWPSMNIQLMLHYRADARQAGVAVEEDDPALFRELFRCWRRTSADYHLFPRRPRGADRTGGPGPPLCWRCC